MRGLVALRYSVLGRIQDARRLDSLIDALYARQPANLDTTQWKCMVDWTKNLHGNSLIAYQTSVSEIIALESRIEKQLAVMSMLIQSNGCGMNMRKHVQVDENINDLDSHSMSHSFALKSPVLIPLYPMVQKQRN